MTRTRLSLFYLASYLLFAGVALVVTGQWVMRLLFSTGEYGEFLPRLLGVVLFALGVLITQIIRYRLEMLYPTTLFVRATILAVLVGLYVSSQDPFFLVLVAVVGFGFVLTGAAYLAERRST